MSLIREGFPLKFQTDQSDDFGVILFYDICDLLEFKPKAMSNNLALTDQQNDTDVCDPQCKLIIYSC